MPSPHDKDAQRDLMERSLTNVRALVDKMEAEEAAARRNQKWLLVAVVLAAVGFAAVLGVALLMKPAPKPVVVTPDKLPPIRPGPPPGK